MNPAALIDANMSLLCPDFLANFCNQPARRAATDGFWQYFHGAPYSPASTRNNQCNSPSTSASVSTVRRTGIKAVASANRSTARRNAQMAARRRSHRSVPLIQRNRALELRSTPARHPGPHRHEAPDDAGPPDAQLSAPVLHLSAPSFPCPPLLSAVCL